MTVHPQVVQDLNDYLSFELTGHRQYLLHGATCRHWGFEQLAQAQLAYSDEETRHAARIMARILLLGATPLMRSARDVATDATAAGQPASAGAAQPASAAAAQHADAVARQLARDRDLVGAAIAHLKGAIGRCEQHRDFASRALLVEMLDDEELHLDWLDRQSGLIDKLGLQHYLQAQI